MNSEQDDLTLVIKCEQGKLKIKPLRYEHWDSEHAYDRSWVQTAIILDIDGFVGNYTASLQDVDFAVLKRDFQLCLADLNKSFTFEVAEHAITLRISGDGLGHFYIKGGCEQPNSSLDFEMTFDQSFLPSMIDELEAITTQFPYNKKEFSI